MKKKDVEDSKTIDIVNKTETISTEDRTIDDLKKVFPDEIENLEETLNNYISDSDRKILKPEICDMWNYLVNQLACFHEYFKSLDEYQKPVTSSRMKTFSACASDESKTE